MTSFFLNTGIEMLNILKSKITKLKFSCLHVTNNIRKVLVNILQH